MTRRRRNAYKELLELTIMALEPYLSEISRTNKNIIEHVKSYAEEFMKREYPDEAPYFDIAWGNFTEVLNNKNDDGLGFKGPTIRDVEPPQQMENDSIMAPKVIHAFYILFTMVAKRIDTEVNEALKQEMVQVLSQNKFSLEFSWEIVDFFIERKESE